MTRIVARRLVCFDAETWAWACQQKSEKNLSRAIRALIRTQFDAVKQGRPSTNSGIYISESRKEGV